MQQGRRSDDEAKGIQKEGAKEVDLGHLLGQMGHFWDTLFSVDRPLKRDNFVVKAGFPDAIK